MTLADLCDWRNANGVEFHQTGGSVWVTSQYEHLLTDPLRNAIRQHQAVVRSFVPPDCVELSADELWKELDCLSSESKKFLRELTA